MKETGKRERLKAYFEMWQLAVEGCLWQSPEEWEQMVVTHFSFSVSLPASKTYSRWLSDCGDGKEGEREGREMNINTGSLCCYSNRRKHAARQLFSRRGEGKRKRHILQLDHPLLLLLYHRATHHF